MTPGEAARRMYSAYMALAEANDLMDAFLDDPNPADLSEVLNTVVELSGFVDQEMTRIALAFPPDTEQTRH
jgi:hypothetical protein